MRKQDVLAVINGLVTEMGVSHKKSKGSGYKAADNFYRGKTIAYADAIKRVQVLLLVKTEK